MEKGIYPDLAGTSEAAQNLKKFLIGDIVLLKADLTTWNQCPMRKIIRANSDDKGDVRSVKLLLEQ